MKAKMKPSQLFRFQVFVLVLEALLAIALYLVLSSGNRGLGRFLSSVMMLGVLSLVCVK